VSEPIWPDPPLDPVVHPEALKLRYAAILESIKADRDLLAARQDDAQKVEDDLRSALHSAYIEVAKDSIARSLQRAQFLTTVAGTIVTLYTGLLGLVYSLATKPIRPLPARGIVPAVFLGLALVFSATYVAFLRSKTRRGRPLPSGIGADIQEQRLVSFIAWVSVSIQQRAWAMRIAVICLGEGVALLPLPFISLKHWQTLTLVCLAIGVLMGWIVFAEIVPQVWKKIGHHSSGGESGGGVAPARTTGSSSPVRTVEAPDPTSRGQP